MRTACDRCGEVLVSKRADARYCSNACRQAAYAGRPPADPDRLCEWCADSLPTGKRADARYCDDRCRAAANNWTPGMQAQLHAAIEAAGVTIGGAS